MDLDKIPTVSLSKLTDEQKLVWVLRNLLKIEASDEDFMAAFGLSVDAFV